MLIQTELDDEQLALMAACMIHARLGVSWQPDPQLSRAFCLGSPRDSWLAVLSASPEALDGVASAEALDRATGDYQTRPALVAVYIVSCLDGDTAPKYHVQPVAITPFGMSSDHETPVRFSGIAVRDACMSEPVGLVNVGQWTHARLN